MNNLRFLVLVRCFLASLVVVIGSEFVSLPYSWTQISVKVWKLALLIQPSQGSISIVFIIATLARRVAYNVAAFNIGNRLKFVNPLRLWVSHCWSGSFWLTINIAHMTMGWRLLLWQIYLLMFGWKKLPTHYFTNPHWNLFPVN